jgi:hypothetical protein
MNTQSTVINVITKSVYGNHLVYPNCELSQKFAKLINKKTFSHADLCIIESMGIVINNTNAL